MKISVILGVSQMSLGIVMKAFNALHFEKKLDFFYEFIPQITLLLCLFGWMDLLIIVKWLTPWQGNESRAPGIVSVMINMFLNFGAIDTDTTDALVFSPNVQETVSILLLIVAVCCIPTMLIVKPLIIFQKMRKERKELEKDDEGYLELNDKENQHENKNFAAKQMEIQQDVNITHIISGDDDHEDHGFGEIVIHQLIETIEFSLGTISNTASYLRLWALSLAHGQLADVFFEKLLVTMGLAGTGSPLMLFVLFPVFASFSFFVLMCMDSMECFLHTLRLHWVEFQNKFYKGTGYKFVPFSFRVELENEINNSTANLIMLDEEEVNLSESNDSIQELQPTIDHIKKKKEEDKKNNDTKEDQTDKKNNIFNDIRKFNRDIDIDSLRDARQRLEQQRKILTENKDIMVMVNVLEEDPESLTQPFERYQRQFNDLSEKQRTVDTDINQTERLLTEVLNLLKSRELLEKYTIEELEGKTEEIKTVNAKVQKVHKDIEVMSDTQNPLIANFIKFMEEEKIKQIDRCSLTENIESSNHFDKRVNF